MEEFVNTCNFIYKGYKMENVLDGDSFAYCPCDIYGTPRLYYGDCHYSCAGQAFDDILKSFNAGDIYNWFNDSEIDSITEDIWLSCEGRGRLFLGKYLAVDDGNIPSKEYVSNVLEYMGGNASRYSVVFNEGGRVIEIPFDEFLSRSGDFGEKVGRLEVPEGIKMVYDELNSRRAIVDKKFPQNMTRAEYYHYTRQESRLIDKIIVEVINKHLNKGLIR